MKAVTGDEMRLIDKVTIEERGIPGMTLMERAGEAVARLILSRLYPRRVVILSGKGNNAGDAFVVARHLDQAGIDLTLLMLASGESLSGDALSCFQKIPEKINKILCKKKEDITERLDGVNCIVDGILGTGVKGPLKGIFADAVSAINETSVPIVAIDIPSGMTSGDEYFNSLCVHADYTVTMGLPKLTMTQYPARGWCGEVTVAALDFPQDLLDTPRESRCELITPELVRKFLPERSSVGHKGSFGSALIIAGSPGMTGAACLTTMSAARSGAGLVYLAIPESLSPIIEMKLTEPVILPMKTGAPGIPDENMFSPVMRKSRNVDAAALGPGMGRSPRTARLIRKLYREMEIPLVLDADGINAFSGRVELLKNYKAPRILSPHPGEFSRLTGIPVKDVNKTRISSARAFSQEYGVILVLKGAATVVAEPGGNVYVNTTGNTALSKGGSGDLLTGLICGFLAQDCDALNASLLGVYLHGMAGELASRCYTERGALPGDVLDALPRAFCEIMTSRKYNT